MAKYSGLFGNITGQEEQRRVETFLDQHGREYVAPVEISTGDPCSAIQPMGWTAPLGPGWFRGLLMPPDHLRKMVPRTERARRRYQIEIDYVQWLAEHDAREDAWDSRLHDLARSATKGMDFVSMIENPPPALLDYIGPKAFPPRIFIEAMAAGDPWALGMSDRIPKKAHALLVEMETLIKKRRTPRERVGLVNPFADEDEMGGVAALREGDYVAAQASPFEDDEDEDEDRDDLTDARLGELDEMFDPNAEGGKVERKGRGRKPRVER